MAKKGHSAAGAVSDHPSTPAAINYWLNTNCFLVAGAMGTRTVHQVDPKAQLIVSVSQTHHENGYTSGEDSSELDSMSLGSQVESSELKGLTTDSDVLSAPQLVDGSGAVVDKPLGSLEQAVLLGWAQQVKKGTSADELQVRTALGQFRVPLTPARHYLCCDWCTRGRQWTDMTLLSALTKLLFLCFQEQPVAACCPCPLQVSRSCTTQQLIRQ